jgi:alpha-tubulin suppressor-like RCC1 family protein
MTVVLTEVGKQRCGRIALWLGAALLVAACGGGGGTSRIISSTLTPEPDAPVTPVTPAGPSVSLAGTARAVANTLYAYQATVTGGAGLAFSWVWGDGSFSAAGNPVQQVWNRPGSYNGVVNATVGSTAATRAFNVVVVAEPISSGVLNACALKPDGSVACWGENVDGQLGNGTFTASSSTPVPVTGLAGVVALTAGGAHNCVLKTDRTASCWGRNEKGALGDGTVSIPDIPATPTTSAIPGTNTSKALPTAVLGLTDAVALSGGTLHTCALKANATVVCWGANESGQLGDGTLIDRLTPTAVPGLTNVVAISAGKQHTCALRSNGTANCWGANVSGQLGNGNVNAVNPPTPVQVAGLTGAVAIDAGTDHTCALKADGGAVCWGQNLFGQLGDGTLIDKASPVPVLALSGAISINAGNRHSCAVKADGRAACWGENRFGQLGDATGGIKPLATIVPGLAGATAISTGKSHTCALKTDGSAACWGLNNLGQVGDGAVTNNNPGTETINTAVTPVLGGAVYWK